MGGAICTGWRFRDIDTHVRTQTHTWIPTSCPSPAQPTAPDIYTLIMNSLLHSCRLHYMFSQGKTRDVKAGQEHWHWHGHLQRHWDWHGHGHGHWHGYWNGRWHGHRHLQWHWHFIFISFSLPFSLCLFLFSCLPLFPHSYTLHFVDYYIL